MTTSTDYKYTWCRTINHAWQANHTLRKTQQGSAFSLICANCGMVRNDVFSRVTGELVGRNYVPPDNYKDEIGMTKDDWRKSFAREYAGTNGRSSRMPGQPTPWGDDD